MIRVLLFLLMFNTPLQQSPPCSPDMIAAAATSLSALASQAEQEAALAPLLEARGLISELEAECGGMAWEDRGARVIGPIDLPAGFYRVHAKTPGFFSATLETISGDCGYTTLLLNEGPGELTDGGEGLIRSDGCRALINIDFVSEPWSLWIERVE